MNKNVYLSIAVLHALLMASVVSAMDETSKEYTATLSNATKALIIIEVVSRNGATNHLNIKVSPEAQIFIKALVAAKEVEQQERQFTKEVFTPFFVDQTPEQVTIKPHVPGTYTVQLPANTPFTTCNPQGKTNIDPALAPFNVSKN